MESVNISKGQVKTSKRLLRLGQVIIKSFLALLIVVLGVLYYQTEIFNFSDQKIIEKSTFYNPYQKWNKTKALKANFHAHSEAWKGITNGHNTERQILDEYKKMGFAVAAVSNYHSISAEKDTTCVYIPCYEHGFNTTKTHILAIDAQEVDKLDFPIGQSLSQKQTRLLNIKKNSLIGSFDTPGFNEWLYHQRFESFKRLRFVRSLKSLL